jgi:hypothetical protein
VGVYATGRGVEINFSPLDDLGHHDLAQDLITKLAEVGNVGIAPGRMWPSVPYAALLRDWPTMRAKVIEPYFRARKGAAAPHMSRGSRALRTQAGRDSGADHPT